MKILLFLVACVILTQAKKCYEPHPAYCARNKKLCKEAGFEKMMKDVCPITCGYCKPKPQDDQGVLEESLVVTAIDQFHNTFPEVESFADCIKAEKECMAASTGWQKIKCVIDLGVCVGGETAKCAQQCGAPLVSCVKTAIFGGKIADVPACFKTFIGCVPGCAKASDMEMSVLEESAVIDAIDHFHYTFPEVESFDDCIKAEKECMAASTGLEKIKCVVDMATCVGGETAKCAQKCGPPLFSCVKTAIFGGKMSDVPTCFKTFIACATDCAKGSDLALPSGPVEECTAEQRICIDSGSGIFNQIKCLVKLGACLTTRLGACGLPCVKPFLSCAYEHISDPVQAMHCYTDLLACVVNNCKTDDIELPSIDESLIINAVVEFHKTFPQVNSFTDCLKAEKACMSASTGWQKIKCVIDMGVCVGGETAKCAQQCGVPLVSCVKTAIFGGKMADVPACFKTFISCAASCAKGGDEVEQFQVLRDSILSGMGANGPVEDCAAQEKVCMSEAGGLIAKLKCIYTFATCLGEGLSECAYPCITPFVGCATKHVLDPVGGLHCYTDLLSCAVEKCHNKTAPVEASFEVESFADCIKAEKECMSASTGFQKIKCIMDVGVCVGGETAKCAEKCGPPLLSCVKTAIFGGGKISDVPACFTAFLTCVKGCAEETTAVETSFPEVESFADCIKAEKECMSASTGFQKIKCIMDVGVCVGGETAKCAEKCGPPLLSCVKTAIFGGGKISDVPACFAAFITCVKGCAEETTAVETSFHEVESFADCIKAEKECMAASTGFQKIKCIVDVGVCVGGETTQCAEKCGPPLLSCVKTAIFGGGKISDVPACFAAFITCVKGCAEETTAVETSFLEVESFADCIKAEKECMAASTGFQKIKCIMDVGVCVGGETAKCAEKCGPPLLSCVKTAIFGGGKISDVPACFAAFITCAKGCAEESEDLIIDSLHEEVLADSSNGPVEECAAQEKVCMGEASGIFAKIRCIIALGKCLASGLSECAIPCIQPFIGCATKHILDPVAAMHCYTDLAACIVEKCHTPAEVLTIDAAIDQFDLSLPGVNSFNDCIAEGEECLSKSTGILKLQCIVKMAICVGGETAKCAHKCEPPAVTCLMEAVMGGHLADVPKCFAGFMKCAQDCAAETEEIDFFEVYEVAIQNAHVGEVDNGIIEIIKQCQDESRQCIAEAHGAIGKAKCFVKFGLCLATKLGGCATQCLPNMAMCMMGAAGDPMKMLKCAMDFVGCAKEKCNTVEEVTTISNNDVIEKLKKCKETNDKCMADADSIKDKAACYLKYGECIAKDLAPCAGPCLPSTAVCMLAATGNWGKMLTCAIQFVGCAKISCSREEDAFEPFTLAIETAHLLETDNGIIDIIKQCQDESRQCIAEAHGAIGKAKCFVKFGLCLGTKLGGCASQCLPNMAMCMMGAAGNPMKTLQCVFGFIACAKEKCNAVEEVTAVSNDDIIEKLKACKEANDKCMAGATSIKEKATCYMGYGLCIGKDLAACAGPCLPQSAWCMMGAHGSWKAMMACGMQFVNCARKECMKNDLLIEDAYEPFSLAVQNAAVGEIDNGVIDIVKECQAEEHECVGAATDAVEKAKCFAMFGLCLAKGLAGCAKQCLPNMAICLMSAHGNPLKTVQCAMEFVACAKSKCNTAEEITALSTGGIIEKLKECKEANERCLAGADGIKEKALCFLSYGVCIGKDLAACAGPCLPKSAWCMMGAHGNWRAMMACAVQFVNCAKTECMKNDLRQIA